MMKDESSDIDVLVVGAGPTGLALASQLARWGVRFRIIDKRPDRAPNASAAIGASTPSEPGWAIKDRRAYCSAARLLTIDVSAFAS